MSGNQSAPLPTWAAARCQEGSLSLLTMSPNCRPSGASLAWRPRCLCQVVCRTPGAALGDSASRQAAPSGLDSPAPHCSTCAPWKGRPAQVCADRKLGAQTVHLYLQCRALRARTSLAHLGVPGGGPGPPWSGTSRSVCPSPPGLHPLPTSESGIQLGSHMSTRTSRPPGPQRHPCIRVRPNLVKFAATMNPRVLFQISSLYPWDSAALRPAALHEPHGLTAHPESSRLSGLRDPRTPEALQSSVRCCACPGHPVTTQVLTPALPYITDSLE